MAFFESGGNGNSGTPCRRLTIMHGCIIRHASTIQPTPSTKKVLSPAWIGCLWWQRYSLISSMETEQITRRFVSLDIT